MPANKNQHFVPQFYLRNFAFDADRRRLRQFRPDVREHVSDVAIKQQCARNHFFGKDGEVEAALTDIESRTAPVISRMVSDLWVPAPTHGRSLK